MSKIIKKYILCLTLSLALLGSGSAAPADSTGPLCKILFIGSSYFNYNDLPGMIKSMADSAGKSVFIDNRVRNGLYLYDHASSTETEAKINALAWDYVVLQGVGRLTAYPNVYKEKPVYPSLQTLRDKILQNCDSTRIIFCLPWAYEDGMTWLQGWTDTYEDMQIKIYENTLQYAKTLDISIAPVGWTWYHVLEEKNYPLHYLHMSDWNHPSRYGSFLMACVVFSSIFLETSINNPYMNELPQKESEYLKTAASDIVLQDLELWRLVETKEETQINKAQSPDHFRLYQNHPNPFNAGTRIQFNISKTSPVNLTVYNIAGKRQQTLLNKRMQPGNYSVSLTANDLPSGVYFYQLKCDNRTTVKKMLLVK